MDAKQLDRIYEISERRAAETDLSFRRYLCGAIDWTPRLVAVLGPRGTGKTTLLLQRMKETDGGAPSALYLSLDNVWLSPREAYEVVEHHVKHGGTSLYLDEVHFLEGWQTLVKNLNDDFRRLRILGSFEPVPLPALLSGHAALARKVLSRLGVVLPHFEAYLRHGGYPFYKEAGTRFEDMLRQAVNQVLDVDWPKIDAVEPQTVRHARRMLSVLASTAPQTPNVTELCRELGVDRKQGVRILYALGRAGLLRLLASDKEKLKNLSTPDKLYCGDPNLMHALAAEPDEGTLRETFFLSQLETVASVTYPARGDFLVDGKWLFEVGGPGKTFGQIADLPESYLAVDDLEIGRGNRIPLWMFGLLY